MPDSFNSHIVTAFRSFAWFVALAMVVLGASVLVGWGSATLALVIVSPGWAAMSPLTAVCFILFGGALAARAV